MKRNPLRHRWVTYENAMCWAMGFWLGMSGGFLLGLIVAALIG